MFPAAPVYEPITPVKEFPSWLIKVLTFSCDVKSKKHLLSSSVDIVVAKGIVALLILAVVLAGAHLVLAGINWYWQAFASWLYSVLAGIGWNWV